MPEMLGPYELGRVHCGDCLELMRALPDGSVPMIWTDPPYGHNQNACEDLVNIHERASGKRRESLAGKREWVLGLSTREECVKNARPIANDSPEDMERVFRGMLREAGRVLSPDCCCCCCCGGGGGPNPQFARVALWMDEAPLEFFHGVVWDKGGLGMGWRYRRNYEMVMVAKRKGGKLLWAWEESGLETANVVRIGKIIPSAVEHPTPKPVELVKHFLMLHTKPGDLVLDPFAGSSPVGVACVEMGRRYLGFEIDARWTQVANERIAAARLGITPAEHRAGQETLFGASDG